MASIKKTSRTCLSKRIVAIALSALLIVLLPFGTLPLTAYADAAGETSQSSASASAEATENSNNAASPSADARLSKTQQANNGAEEAESGPLLDALGKAGAAAYARWLEGESLSQDELSAIDVEALRRIDPEAADAIAKLQKAASTEAEASASASKTSDQPIESPTEKEPGEASGRAAVPSQSGQVEREEAAGVSQEGSDGGADRADDAAESEYLEWSYEGDATYTPQNVGVSLTTTKFIAVIGEPARKLAAENDLYASVMIAQAILESASGNSGLASAPYFNLFGIKGSYRGSSVTMSTQEDDGTGNHYTIDAAFRSYPSYRESLADYVDLLSGDFYAPAHKSRTASFVGACDYLQGTYATSTSYSASLQDIIVTYDLTRYDEPLDYAPAYTYTVLVQDEAAMLLGGEDSYITEERDLVDLVAEATSHLGCAYAWGADGPDEFDCSGFVQYCYAQSLGIALPRTTDNQCLEGTDVDFKDLHMGDLLFFTNDEGTVNHAAMYLAEGCYIESTSPGGVQVTSMEEHMPELAKRVVPTSPPTMAASTSSGSGSHYTAMDAEELQLYMLYLGL